MANQQLIFVYGSLMEGFWNYDRSLKGHIIEKRIGYVKGTLYHLTHKGFPALLPGDTWVKGELFLVEDYDTLFPILSEIEGFISKGHPDNEYDLTDIDVYDEDKKFIESVPFYDYVVANDPEFEEKAELIPDGDWRAYMETHK